MLEVVYTCAQNCCILSCGFLVTSCWDVWQCKL